MKHEPDTDKLMPFYGGRVKRCYSGGQRHRIAVKYHWKCRWCGCELTDKTLTIDHIVATDRPSRIHSDRELVAACQSCNASKSGLTISQWRVRLHRLLANLLDKQDWHKTHLTHHFVTPKAIVRVSSEILRINGIIDKIKNL